MKKINYHDLKVGQNVWTIQSGDCTISSLTSLEPYPIVAGGIIYSIDGKYTTTHAYPSLYLSNPFKDTQNNDRVVEVRDYVYHEWTRRVFHLEKNGTFLCWANSDLLEAAKSSLSLTSWRFMREIEPKTTLTKQQIANKFGINNIENLIIEDYVSDKLIVNTGDRYDALVAAHNFIKTGANTYSSEQRIALVELLHNLIK